MDNDRIFIEEIVAVTNLDDQHAMEFAGIVWVTNRLPIPDRPNAQLDQLREVFEMGDDTERYYRQIFNKIYRVNIPIPEIGSKRLMCPLCRTFNTVPPSHKNVVGIDNQCVICWDHQSQIYLPQCGHICLCVECFKMM